MSDLKGITIYFSFFFYNFDTLFQPFTTFYPLIFKSFQTILVMLTEPEVPALDVLNDQRLILLYNVLIFYCISLKLIPIENWLIILIRYKNSNNILTTNLMYIFYSQIIIFLIT